MKTTHFVCICLILTGTIALAQTNPVPFVNQPLVPMSASPGGSSFTLTVNGTGFVPASVVNWNGTPLVTTFVNSSQLTATVSASNIAIAGTSSVTVVNPATGASNVDFFDVSSPVNSLTFTQLESNPSFVFAESIVAADFNGDTKLDLAYLSSATQGIAVIQLGNGDGTFRAPVTYTVGDTPQGLVVGDFNGDRKLDLAVTNTQDNTISVLLGNGDGTFQSQIVVPTATAPQVLVTGDFNGDGKPDLAVGNRFGNKGDVGGISILLGNGDGTFRSHVDYEIGISADSMTMGDFNRDGKLDIFYLSNVTLQLLKGNGDGTFQSRQSFLASPSVESFITADVDGDGKLDLIVADFGGGAYVILGNGDGTFQSPVGYAAGRTSIALATSDFDADGRLDVALANQNDDSFSVLLGNGDGTFQIPTDFPTSSSAFSVAAGDFNGDGKMDLAIEVSDSATSPNNSVVVFLQGQFAVASFSPQGLTFGQQTVGTTSTPQNVILTNTGSLALTISNISITGANASDFSQKSNCPGTLGINASCQISVTFTPPVSVSATASLSIADNAPGSPQTVNLTGTTPVFLSPTNVTFPNQYVGTSGLPQSVMLTNTGTSTLIITSVTASPADFAPLSACGSSVAPGSSCSIGVFFDPTTSGTRNGVLTVTDGASGGPQTATLAGTGQDFSVAVSSSSSATVTPGQTANYTVAIAPGGGFNQTVALSCSGAPAMSTCSLSSSSLQLNGSGSASVAVTVLTSGTSAKFAHPYGFPGANSKLALWLGISGLSGLVLLGRSGNRSRKGRDRRLCALAFLCLFCLAVTWSACGGGSSSTRGGGTPAGTYNLTVTGSFASGPTTLNHAAKLTLVVQ